MRLISLMTRQPLRYRMFLTMIRLTSGHVPDIMRLMTYRPTFFGQNFAGLVERYLRGPSEWSVAEREALAVFISERNTCPFCVRSHRAVVVGTGHPETLEAIYDVSGGNKLQVALVLAERLTRDADSVTAADIAPLRAVGISEEGITTVIGIVTLFNMINRIANALDFAPPNEREAAQEAKNLLAHGYRI